MTVKCYTCQYQDIRCKFPKKHTSKNCIQNVTAKSSELEKEYRELKKKRKSLLDDYSQLRVRDEAGGRHETGDHRDGFLLDSYRWEDEYIGREWIPNNNMNSSIGERNEYPYLYDPNMNVIGGESFRRRREMRWQARRQAR